MHTAPQIYTLSELITLIKGELEYQKKHFDLQPQTLSAPNPISLAMKAGKWPQPSQHPQHPQPHQHPQHPQRPQQDI